MKQVIESGFFDTYKDEATGKFDREYSSAQFRELFSLFFTNGIFVNYGDEFAVTANGTMEVSVGGGFAFIDGAWLKSSEVVPFTVPNNSTISERVDGIFLQSSLLDRNCSIVYREADIEPIRNNTTQELLICTITVPSDASSLTQSNVTDMRPTEQCGFVGGAVQQLSVSELYAQFTQQFTEWMEAEQADFDAWLENVKNQLSEDAAGNLQLQIETLEQQIEVLEQTRPSVTYATTDPIEVEEGTLVMVYEEE